MGKEMVVFLVVESNVALSPHRAPSPRTAKVSPSPPRPSSPQGSVPGRGGHLGERALLELPERKVWGERAILQGFSFFRNFMLFGVSIFVGYPVQDVGLRM